MQLLLCAGDVIKRETNFRLLLSTGDVIKRETNLFRLLLSTGDVIKRRTRCTEASGRALTISCIACIDDAYHVARRSSRLWHITAS